MVSDTAGRFDIVNDSRRLRLAGKSGHIIADNVRNWPQFEADINIILTKCPISYTTQDAYTAPERTGLMLTPNHRRVAIINAERPKTLQQTVAHYMGHLLVDARAVAHLDKYGHCRRDECVMQANMDWRADRSVMSVFDLLSNLASGGMSKPSAEHKAEHFCVDCKDVLKGAALQVFLYKNGLAR